MRRERLIRPTRSCKFNILQRWRRYCYGLQVFSWSGFPDCRHARHSAVRRCFFLTCRQSALYSCRMRRERLIRPTRSCKFNILHEPRRPDKRSASGSFACASTFNTRLKPGIEITLLSFAVARPFRLVYGAYQYFWCRDGVFSPAASLSL